MLRSKRGLSYRTRRGEKPHKKEVFGMELESLFTERKMHLNNRLNIVDIATALQSNRTYVSAYINRTHGLNFCNYVNRYRLAALEEKIRSEIEYTNTQLAEQCGFGSVDSMKRAVRLGLGMSLHEWKKTLR